MPLSSHLYPAVWAQLLRASESADWLEWSDWASPILVAPLRAQGGIVTVPSAPGSGIAWDEAAVTRHAI